MDNMQIPTTLQIQRKIYTGTAARVLKLMSAGCTAVQTAHAIGIDESYVSQLSCEEDFQLQVAEALKKDMERAIEVDKNYGDIEKRLSDRLRELLPMITSADQILRILKFANEAKRRTQNVIPDGANGYNGNGNNTLGGNIVRLVLPNIITQVFVTNPNNEVVAVNQRELVTLDSKSMEGFVKAKKEIPKPLPTVRIFENESQDKWNNL